jgi:hypothetical protein
MLARPGVNGRAKQLELVEDRSGYAVPVSDLAGASEAFSRPAAARFTRSRSS